MGNRGRGHQRAQSMPNTSSSRCLKTASTGGALGVERARDPLGHNRGEPHQPGDVPKVGAVVLDDQLPIDRKTAEIVQDPLERVAVLPSGTPRCSATSCGVIRGTSVARMRA